MKQRAVIFFAMWGAAIGVLLFLWLGQQPGEDEPEAVSAQGAPLHRAEDGTAPREKRVGLPVTPPVEGPPASFRNDRRHTGRSPYVGPSSARLAWSHRTGARISGQASVARDGTIYVGSHDGQLYALSPHGRELWKRTLDGPIFATPLVADDGTVYCGSDGDAFFAFRRDGSPRFRLPTEDDADTGASAAPDGTIHFASGRRLFALSPRGDVRWRFEARGKIYSTPAVDEDGTVYVGSQDDYFYAIAADGRMRWSYRTGDDNDASPVIGDDGTLYFGSDDKNVYALSRDGDLVWATRLEGYVRAPLALGTDGQVYASVYGPRPAVVSLDARTGALRWVFRVTVADSPEVGVHSGVLVDRDGNVYVGAHDDFLYALTADGDLRFVFETDGDIDSPPVLTPDGTLLFGSDDGVLYAIH